MSRLALLSGLSAIVLAICCFTPVLVIALTALGLGAWIAGLDAVLLPPLGLAIALFIVGLWRGRSADRKAGT